MRHLPLAFFPRLNAATLALATVLLLCLLLPGGGGAAPKPADKAAADAQAKEARAALKTLTADERRVHKELERAEQDMAALEQRIKAAEKEWRAQEEAVREVSGRLAALQGRNAKDRAELESLLQKLWPVQVRRDVLQGRSLPDWEEADREFVWLATVHDKVQQSLREVLRQEQDIRTTLEQRRVLAEQAQARLRAVNADKDKLLEQRLRFQRDLAAVRKRKLDQEEELKALLALVEELQYTVSTEPTPAKPEPKPAPAAKQEPPKPAAPKVAALEPGKPSTARLPFKQLQGKLPWPVQGREVVPFKPSADPPQRGVGLAVAEGAPVRAVSWGRGGHSDVLRGMGTVVVLLHGEDYYSLYAYLADSLVQKGQEVAQGQNLGRVGYYPEAKGGGVYFELRFHQKPINPRQWLIAQK